MVEFAAATTVAIIQLAFLAQTIVGLPIRSAVALEARAMFTTNQEKCHDKQLSKRSPIIDHILGATCCMRWLGCAPSDNTSQNAGATNQVARTTSHDAPDNEHNERASTATGREPPPDARPQNPREPPQAGGPAVKRREWKARAHSDKLDALD